MSIDTKIKLRKAKLKKARLEKKIQSLEDTLSYKEKHLEQSLDDYDALAEYTREARKALLSIFEEGKSKKWTKAVLEREIRERLSLDTKMSCDRYIGRIRASRIAAGTISAEKIAAATTINHLLAEEG